VTTLVWRAKSKQLFACSHTVRVQTRNNPAPGRVHARATGDIVWRPTRTLVASDSQVACSVRPGRCAQPDRNEIATSHLAGAASARRRRGDRLTTEITVRAVRSAGPAIVDREQGPRERAGERGGHAAITAGNRCRCGESGVFSAVRAILQNDPAFCRQLLVSAPRFGCASQ
jgi:hypothetical protein